MGRKEESVRIQTSVLNGIEKKILVWLAERQPRWMTSDILTFIGTFGAIIIAAGYILSAKNINFLWLSSFGFVVNWYGDSLDGTLARVRKKQRPVYGYYLDHTVDVINEVIMFVGAGLSGLLQFELALFILVVYLMLTVNVSVNAHLKQEFKLTYAKMGPTEFRIIVIIINTILLYVTPIREEIREVNQEGTCSLSPLATSDVPLVLSADSEKSKPKAKRRKPSTPCPWESGARIPEDLDEWAAAEYPTINAGEEFKKFVGWALSKDMRYARWDQAFRNWMGNALKFQSQRGGYGGSGYRSKRQPTCPGDWEKEYKGVDYTRGAVMKEFTPEESARLATLAEEMNF